jgi:hypothetical protein
MNMYHHPKTSGKKKPQIRDPIIEFAERVRVLGEQGIDLDLDALFEAKASIDKMVVELTKVPFKGFQKDPRVQASMLDYEFILESIVSYVVDQCRSTCDACMEEKAGGNEKDFRACVERARHLVDAASDLGSPVSDLEAMLDALDA